MLSGVIALRSQRGADRRRPHFTGAVSFGTVQGTVATQGERGANAWSFSLQGGRTENERVNNAFESTNTVIRVDRAINDRIAAGATFRWFHGVYGSPGDRYANDPDNEEREDNVLATAFVQVTLARGWTARTLLGGQDRRFVAESRGD